MKLSFDAGVEAFRDEFRAWLADNAPTAEEMAAEPVLSSGHVPGWASRWTRRMFDAGWLVPGWPPERGGRNAGPIETLVYQEELTRAHIPRTTNPQGLGIIAPSILDYGNEDQIREYAMPVLRGERAACLGMSEPGAGSDLAAVQTRAVKDGDDYVVNGQKIWTSGAHVAKYMILLARSDPDAAKHKGISYFIVDMKSPGITIRPLVNMANNHDFNEVFFDNVRVPAKNMIGEENRGWYVGTTTLDFERSGIATSISHTLMVEDLAQFVRENRGAGFVSESSGVRNEIADRMIEAGVEGMLCTQVISMQNRGLLPTKESSIAKLFSSELDVRIANTGMHVLGLYGQLKTGDPLAPTNGRLESMYLYATTSTVGGGTSEIQRNIIASRGLGMPRD